MVKTILAVLLAAAPAGAADFDLAGLRAAAVADAALTAVPEPGPAARAEGSRYSVSEIDNRWIASIYVTANNLKAAAAALQGLDPYQGPAGHAYEVGAASRRVSAAAEALVGYWQDRRWGMLQLETEKLDRVIPTLRDLEASIKGRPNYYQLKGPDLARAAADLASALQWLRADSGGMLR